MKKILMILQGTCLLLLLICQSVALAAAPVVDQAKLLSDSQREALTLKIRQVEADHKVKIGIYTLQNLPNNMSPGKMADNILDKDYAGGENGSIVLLIAMGSRDWYISTDNNMRARITDEAGINGLKNLFLEDLSDGEYNASFNNFIDGVDKYLTYYEENGEPYDPSCEFNMLAGIVALLVAAVGGGFFAFYLICGMSNVAPAIEASAYLEKNSVDIWQQQDKYLYTTVTRHKKSKSSSSSSSGSSHGGGGGKF